VSVRLHWRRPQWRAPRGCLDTNANGDCLDDGFHQRPTAQPFTLGALAEGAMAWNIQQLFVYGFVLAGTLNEQMN
jgi:hypothetical protein